MILSDSERLYNSQFFSDFFLYFYLMYLRGLNKDTVITQPVNQHWSVNQLKYLSDLGKFPAGDFFLTII